MVPLRGWGGRLTEGATGVGRSYESDGADDVRRILGEGQWQQVDRDAQRDHGRVTPERGLEARQEVEGSRPPLGDACRHVVMREPRELKETAGSLVERALRRQIFDVTTRHYEMTCLAIDAGKHGLRDDYTLEPLVNHGIHPTHVGTMPHRGKSYMPLSITRAAWAASARTP